MRRLVIDTATRACSVALFDECGCIASFYEEIGRGHAERLVPMIAELPERGRAEAISVNVGPGSFTGIRVGVSAAKALALAWGAECDGYGCLDLIAAMAAQGDPMLGSFAVVMTGGHGEYFVQAFDGGKYPGTQPPLSVPFGEAYAELKQRVIAGDAAQAFVEARGWGTAIQVMPDARCWNLLGETATLPPSPFYGRSADAKLPGGIVQ